MPGLRRSRTARTNPAPADPIPADPAPTGSAPADPGVTAPSSSQSPVDGLSIQATTPTTTPTASPPPRTRTSAAWVALCAAALAFVVLIIFMLQNTGSVEINFLWMDGDVPLALALFIAAVGAAIVALAVGTARMTQLRRVVRQRRD